MKINTAHHGMTLTELLVVIAVLAILVTLMAPSATNILKRVSNLRCQNNLARIGQTSLQDERKGIKDPATWHTLVLKEVGYATEILKCPEGSSHDVYGTTPGSGPGQESETMRNFLKDYRYRIGTFTWMFWTKPDGSKMSAQERWGFSTPWQYFQVDNSYFVRRVSDTGRNTLYNVPYLDDAGNVFWYRGVYNTFLLTQLVDHKNSDGSPRVSTSPQQCMVMQYTPDSDPYKYWAYSEVNIIPPDANINLANADCAGAGSSWGYSGQTVTYNMSGAARAGEDRWYTWAAGGYNFPESPNRDSTFRIIHTPEGTTEIAIRVNRRSYGYSTEVGFNGYCPYIVKKAAVPSADTVIVSDQQGEPKWGSVDPELYEKVIIGTPSQPLPPEATSNTYVVSYGLNAEITNSKGLSPDKILAIDYNHLVVDKNDVDDQADWAAALNPFARHNGKINTLMRGGYVRQFGPTDINPTIPSNFESFWNP